MPEPYASRVRTTVLGLAAGDGAAWPSTWQRMPLLPRRRTERLGTLWEFGLEHHTTSIAMPYLHATSPEVLDVTGPTDDAEWLVVALRHLTGCALDGAPANAPHQIWSEIATLDARSPESVRARIGTRLALTNLQRGLEPPSTGRFNAHYFDDIGCVRAIAGALLRPGQPDEAADLAESDVAVTHALDGLWCARASAALFAVLVDSGDARSAVDAAQAQLPPDSWSQGVVGDMIAAAEASRSQLDLSARLEHTCVDQIYSYPVLAPETLGLLLAHLSRATSAEDLLLAAFSHPRQADALVPLAGAAAAAAFGDHWLPRTVTEGDLLLQGVSISALAGVSVTQVIDSLGGG